MIIDSSSYFEAESLTDKDIWNMSVVGWNFKKTFAMPSSKDSETNQLASIVDDVMPWEAIQMPYEIAITGKAFDFLRYSHNH